MLSEKTFHYRKTKKPFLFKKQTLKRGCQKIDFETASFFMLFPSLNINNFKSKLALFNN